MAGIALRALAGVTRPTAEGPPVPTERGRILVKLSLPRDTLIEFVVRCWLGLGVESVLPGASGISHSGGPRAGARRGGEVGHVAADGCYEA